MVMVNAKPEGGIEFDEDFFLAWPDGYLPHQVRLQGGDASSDSYCYP
jgi:selenium-binding protein 1